MFNCLLFYQLIQLFLFFCYFQLIRSQLKSHLVYVLLSLYYYYKYCCWCSCCHCCCCPLVLEMCLLNCFYYRFLFQQIIRCFHFLHLKFCFLKSFEPLVTNFNIDYKYIILNLRVSFFDFFFLNLSQISLIVILNHTWLINRPTFIIASKCIQINLHGVKPS